MSDDQSLSMVGPRVESFLGRVQNGGFCVVAGVFEARLEVSGAGLTDGTGYGGRLDARGF